MDTKTAIAKLKAIFEEDEVTEYGPEDVVLNEGPVCKMGVFYTKPGPRGDVLWAGDLGAEDEASTQVPLLALGLLEDITYGYVDEEELHIYFQLGDKVVITHEIHYMYYAGDTEAFNQPSSTADIISLMTHRLYYGGEGKSLMAALAYGPHTSNVQMAIESQFERHLFGMRRCPDTRALAMLEKCLRHDVELGVPRSAMQYAMLHLHGSDEARELFDREVAHKALSLEGVPALITYCLAYHCFWRGLHDRESRVLLDADGLVIAAAMGEEYAIEPLDLVQVMHERMMAGSDEEPCEEHTV